MKNIFLILLNLVSFLCFPQSDKHETSLNIDFEIKFPKQVLELDTVENKDTKFDLTTEQIIISAKTDSSAFSVTITKYQDTSLTSASSLNYQAIGLANYIPFDSMSNQAILFNNLSGRDYTYIHTESNFKVKGRVIFSDNKFYNISYLSRSKAQYSLGEAFINSFQLNSLKSRKNSIENLAINCNCGLKNNKLVLSGDCVFNYLTIKEIKNDSIDIKFKQNYRTATTYSNDSTANLKTTPLKNDYFIIEHIDESTSSERTENLEIEFNKDHTYLISGIKGGPFEEQLEVVISSKNNVISFGKVRPYQTYYLEKK